MRPLPNINDLKEAFVTSLLVDTPLMSVVADIRNGSVGDTVVDYSTGEQVEYDWDLPYLEYGLQLAADDPRNGYGDKGLLVNFRLVAHDRGQFPGEVNYDRCHTALTLANEALEAMPRQFGDWKVWRLRLTSIVPDFPEDDSGAFTYVMAGHVYEIRIH